MSSQLRTLAFFFIGAALIIAASLFSVSGFSKSVATVDGEKISKEEFKKALSLRVGMHKARGVSVGDDALKRAVLNDFIDNIIILKEAKKRGVSVSDSEINGIVEAIKKGAPAGEFEKQLKGQNLSYADFVKRVRNDVIIEKFERGLVTMDSVTDDDLKMFYESGYRPVTTPERTQLRLIEFKSKEDAEKVTEDMKNKAIPFDRMAETLKKRKDGSIIVSFSGWVQSDVFSPQVAEAIRGIRKGGYGGPIQGKDGWYIIKVEDRKEAAVASFEESKDQLRVIALEQKQRAALQRWIEKQRASVKITINEKAM